jgi:PAS domain S-box-containing protein
MPQFNGLDAIALLKETGIDIPLIIVSGVIGEETAADCMRYGAHDYIMKDKLARLVPAIERELKEAESRSKRRQAERALRENEEKYRHLFENANESIFVAQDAKLVLANPMTTMMTGYSAEELTSRPFIEFIHPDDRGMVIDRHVRRFKGEEIPHTYSFRIIRKDGSIRWGNLSAVLISWDGKPATLNFLNDITDLKRADVALRQSEAKYRDIFDKTLEGIYRSTPEGKFDILNPAFARICGYASPEEMMEKVTDIANQLYANPEDRSRFQKLIAAEEEVKGFELQFKHPTKGQVWISLNARAIRDEQGNIRYYDGTIEDISERKRAEELLKKNEEKYRNLFDNAVEGVFQSTPEGRLISVNTAFARMFGYNSAEEIVNTVTDIASQVYANPDDRKIAVRMMTETGYINNFECQMRRKDGGTFWARYDGHVTETEDGINCFQGFIIDISERRQSEEKLQQTLENLRKAFIASIQLLVSAVESRDPYTAGHQIRSTNLARAIATEMGLPRDKIEGLRMAGSIHDIGKLSIPAEILSKPTRLTNIEFSLIKEHARAGYEMLKDVESPWPLAEIVHQHHERMDGSGYPRNLKGEEILMEARILAVADVVESMASHRPYRPAIGIEAALEEIKKNKGILYDDAVADACLRLFREKGFKL